MRALVCLLLLTACEGCATVRPYEPAILREALPPGKGAVTLCAMNNVPYVVVDSGTQGLEMDVAIIEHERVHVRQAVTYRGGCWPWLHRYQADTAFRRAAEFEAYCVWGRWLMAHNRDPRSLWAFITLTMYQRHGAIVRRNCLYEEGS